MDIVMPGVKVASVEHREGNRRLSRIVARSAGRLVETFPFDRFVDITDDGGGHALCRGGDPEDERWLSTHEVDYTSGAALFVRGSVLRELGGFDQRYAPAYYEDTDLCFAIRDRGLRVLVLEKGSDPRYPCNTRWSGGIIHVGYVDPKAPPDAVRAGIARNTNGHTDPALAEVLVSETPRVIDWLRAQGGRFIRAGAVAWQNWMMAPPRPLVAGLDWQGRGPDVMLRRLGV